MDGTRTLGSSDTTIVVKNTGKTFPCPWVDGAFYGFANFCLSIITILGLKLALSKECIPRFAVKFVHSLVTIEDHRMLTVFLSTYFGFWGGVLLPGRRWEKV